MSDKYDLAEKDYMEGIETFLKAKDHYEWIKAKRREILRVTLKDSKPTILEIEDKLKIEENEVDDDLRKAYLSFIFARGEKEKKRLISDSESRKYWDNRGINS